METKDGKGARFIQRFAQNSAEGNAHELIRQFADSFLYAGPAGNQWMRASDFALALPKRKHRFEELGHRSTELIEAQEIWLGDRYVLVRSRWRFVFERLGQAVENLDTESNFLVDTGAEPFRILVYVSQLDPLEVLRERAVASSSA